MGRIVLRLTMPSYRRRILILGALDAVQLTEKRGEVSLVMHAPPPCVRWAQYSERPPKIGSSKGSRRPLGVAAAISLRSPIAVRDWDGRQPPNQPILQRVPYARGKMSVRKRTVVLGGAHHEWRCAASHYQIRVLP
jgi:hypothetical protein